MLAPLFSPGLALQVPRKVWIVVTNRNVSLLGRITKDPILSVPLLQIVFMGYLPCVDLTARFKLTLHAPVCPDSASPSRML